MAWKLTSNKEKRFENTAMQEKVGKFTSTAFEETTCKPYSDWEPCSEKGGERSTGLPGTEAERDLKDFYHLP